MPFMTELKVLRQACTEIKLIHSTIQRDDE